MLGVFYVQRKDMPSDGTVCKTFPTGGAGRLPGKPEQNAVPTKGDTMGMARAGNGSPPPATGHHIFSVHTAVLFKGAAGFFYSTHFYHFPIPAAFSVSPKWLKLLTGFKQKEKLTVDYFDTETLEIKRTEMFISGYKASLMKDTSYKGLWKISFTLKEF